MSTTCAPQRTRFGILWWTRPPCPRQSIHDAPGSIRSARNGALTVGTLDGANVEIRDGAENFFLFGMTTPEVVAALAGYRPAAFIEKSEPLRRVVELVRSGFFSPHDPARGRAIAEYLEWHDTFMVAADFDDYLRVQAEVSAAYRDRAGWMARVVDNVASMAPFSSDETIRRYARDVWNVEPVPVTRETGG